MRYDSFIRETCLIHMWDTTRWYGRHDSIICETWLDHMWDMTHSPAQPTSFICETRLSYTWDTTRWYVQATVQRLAEKACVLKAIDVNLQVCIYSNRSLFICVDMTHSYLWHDSFICVTWLIHMCDMTPSYVWHDSFICVDMTHSYERYDSIKIVTWLVHMWDMTHAYVRHDAFICETWLIHMCRPLIVIYRCVCILLYIIHVL